MSNVWLTQSVINQSWLKMKSVESSGLNGVAICQIKLFVENTTSTKQHMDLEVVLLSYQDSQFIVILLRACNKLTITEGRYYGIIREERSRNYCDAGVMGDKYQVLFHC